jgi:hypothetical protein
MDENVMGKTFDVQCETHRGRYQSMISLSEQSIHHAGPDQIRLLRRHAQEAQLCSCLATVVIHVRYTNCDRKQNQHRGSNMASQWREMVNTPVAEQETNPNRFSVVEEFIADDLPQQKQDRNSRQIYRGAP